ncbi:ABC transporter substrate-binding protein [Lacticaseibacillus saniviri]|nr:ABC transporter substrate-binding protein [Lacticaseibacillus saniviri]MCG4282243.1 ABC transporter substrate-binding protein [Lacticaseibacillus saniviri]
MKKGLLVTAALALTLVLAACGKSQTSDSKQVKIGILQLVDQSALNASRKGFEEGLKEAGYSGKKVKIDYVNAQGDQANLKTMSERLANDHNTLNLAIATPAAQALQKADSKTPMLFTAITDAKSAGLVTDLKKPDANATGVTDKVDVLGQIKFLHKLFPKAKTVGVLYNAAEQNSVFQVKEAKKAITSLGLKMVANTAATTNDVEQATMALTKKADVLYIPNDNVAAAAMPTIGKVSEKTKTPVINADATMVKFAGVATRGISYEELGKQTAKMAVKLIKGDKVSDLPVENPEKTELVTDKSRMKLFGITEDMVKGA